MPLQQKHYAQLPLNCISNMAEDDSNQLLNPYYAEVPVLRTGHAKLKHLQYNSVWHAAPVLTNETADADGAQHTYKRVQEEPAKTFLSAQSRHPDCSSCFAALPYFQQTRH